ncbi:MULTISPECIES: 3-hydroxyisobutyrate dehydrogenase [unclassified Novosphingobium]|uniref:3-hydroxyisobutyrate dehydrogenase n=1 Tax=unclassified Novosphingobium TaxID=2644732 RepID=UPI00020EF4C0|nr:MULTISPECIES: 3-hydroxyisobutyrate dehydrogenase [unclassified Novosphingobium]GFM29801.1 3-hydroxyisobutyrate dehydrogenase [Novosphingobium sp. PY1]CCA92909.1 3-hydroxyisobutyrate dehydrogenase [Novosphingobium sp. PP1Y]
MKIAFIGLGNMGGGMAANLVKAGHEVHAFDLSEEALAKAAEHGCATYSAVPEAVAGVDAVVTMLPNGAIVKGVYTKDVIGKAPEGALFLDCSTIDLATAREVAGLAEAAGYQMVDAPVSGGIAAANGGTLTFMVGGSDAAFEKAKTVLDPMAKAVIHAGAIGSGQVAKMCNNMLLAIHMIGTCEALALAEKAGLDPQKFYEISSKSTGYNWSLNDYTPAPGVGATSPADNGYQGGFASALMLKDLRLAMEGAQTAGASVPMGEHAKAIYEAFVEAGNGGKDFGAIFTTL